jgi:hypothetical protein
MSTDNPMNEDQAEAMLELLRQILAELQKIGTKSEPR